MSKLALFGGAPIRRAPYPRWPQWSADEQLGVTRVLESGRWWASEGEQVPAFEAAWAQFCGVAHAIAVTNGTHALESALLAADVGQGDEVIVTDYSFFASASAVAAINAIPVLVDIEPRSFTIDCDSVEAAITPRTRAVIAVHLAGHPADLDRLEEICTRHGLALIEDCAHAHGSTWRNRPVGGFGTAGTWSFQQSKLMTAGEGGAVTVTDADIALRVRSFADCGRRAGEWFYSHFALGSNYRMTEWQAAVLLAQLARFPAQNRQRNDNAIFLNEALAAIPGVIPQYRDARTTSQGYYCYLVRIDEATFGAQREAVHRALEAEGIPMTMSYPALHALQAFAAADGLAPQHRRRAGWPDYSALDLPVARMAAATTLWFKHQLLLGSRTDAQCLVDALAKVQGHAHELQAPCDE
jgi:dTDP-4-amino-4,6-dideoxygalactose transaminase